MPKEIILPVLTSDFESGTIESWTKNEGDPIEKGEVLLLIETDKAVVEVEAEESGVLGKILVPGGMEDVKVNSVIGVLLQDGESASDLEGFSDLTAEPASVPVSATTSATVETTTASAHAASAVLHPADGGRIFASPLARRIAAGQGVDLKAIKGRGPNGRILKADVEQAAKAPVSRQQTTVGSLTGEGGYTAIPNNKMRKTIARRLGESKRDVPHFYLSVDCELDALLALRKKLNAKSPQGEAGYKVSVNDFIIKASALALRDVPAVNSSWTEEAIHQYHNVDISVAVATAGGLITPIVRMADAKGLATISNEVKALAARAQDGKLKPEEFQGGGFSISNLGMFGITQFNAIVNPPQSCILAVGAGQQRAVVKDGELCAATVMTCTLSADHRCVDGAVGAQFLQAFKGYIEQPLDLKMLGGS